MTIQQSVAVLCFATSAKVKEGIEGLCSSSQGEQQVSA
jgi:hypothetical protein